MMDQLNAHKNVHFNRGQRLTPENLNAISEFGLARDALTVKSLIGNAGIVHGFGENFALDLRGGDLLTIATGLAVNTLGEIIHLQTPAACSLKNLAPSEPTVYYIQLVPKIILEEPFQDLEFAEIKGFRYQAITAEVEVSKELKSRAVEIARVLVDSESTVLNLEVQETSAVLQLGTVDHRFAKRIHLYTQNLLAFEQHFRMKEIVAESRELFENIETLYPQAQKFVPVAKNLLNLQMEIQEPVMQVFKLQFIMTELRRSLLGLMEEIRYLIAGFDKKNSQADFWTELLETIDRLSNKSGSASFEEFLALATVNKISREYLLKVKATDEHRMLILESIKSLRHVPFGQYKTQSFAGVLYEKVASLDSLEINKQSTKDSEFTTIMTVKTQYDQETPFNARGFFTTKGKIHLPLTGLTAGLETVVIWQLYKRRGLCQYNLQFNGKDVFSERIKPHDHVNRMLNVGTSIPGRLLSAGENVLTFDIPATDMDFGLFSISVYQAKGSV